MKYYFSFLTICLSFISFSQDELIFTEFGSEPAYCRLYSYQNGNGVVYISASGGVPDYTYLWTELATGTTTTNSTWGGRNPGLYKIELTDAMGTVKIDTLRVDSLSPIASFNVSSSDLDIVDWGHVGVAPVTATFTNTSHYFSAPHNPSSDTTFFFRPQGFEEWEIHHNYGILENYTFEYGGVFTASLIALNQNGCQDTCHATIGLFGPLTINEGDQAGLFTISTHSSTNEVNITKLGFEDGLVVNFYSLSGKLIQSENIVEEQTTILLNVSSGMYIYEVVDSKSGRLRDSGKLTF